MDPESYVLSPRARRAAALIAAALTVMVVGGLLYMRPAVTSRSSVIALAPMPQLEARYRPAFDFVTPSMGWAAVSDAGGTAVWVYRTADGSKHWQLQFAVAERSFNFPTIRFFDATNGYLLTDRLYRTQDGGRHWYVISLPDATQDFDLASPTTGWAVDPLVTPALLYSTKDGGLTWQVVGKTPAPLYAKGFGGYAFRAGGEGWAGAQAGEPTVYGTFDGGETWKTIVLPSSPSPPLPSPEPVGKGWPYPPTYETAVLLPPGNGVIVDEVDGFGRQSLYFSLDRGASWDPLAAVPLPAGFGEISFIDSRHWWASRLDVMYATSDGGRTWRGIPSAIDVPGDWTVDMAHAIDPRHGWLTMTMQPGYGPRNQATMLLMTSDGGKHWTPVNVPHPR